MWRFYWGLVCRIPALLWVAANRWKSIAAFILFFLALFNRQLGGRLVTSWHAISLWWAFLPVGILFVYGLMKSNYEHFCQLESNLNQKLTEQDRRYSVLQEENSRLNLEVNELKNKPPRTPFQERELQRIKSTIDGDSEQCRSVLRCLLGTGKLTRNTAGKVLHPPTGLTEAQTVEALTVLESQHLVVPSGQWIQNGYETTWEIPEKIELMLEELL
jgi:hypothetical protein